QIPRDRRRRPPHIEQILNPATLPIRQPPRRHAEPWFHTTRFSRPTIPRTRRHASSNPRRRPRGPQRHLPPKLPLQLTRKTRTSSHIPLPTSTGVAATA